MSAAIAVRGELLLSESFGYPDGAIVGAAGSPWAVHSGTTGPANVVGGMLELTQLDGEDIHVLFAGANVPVLYASFPVNFSELPGGTGNYLAHFRGTTATSFRGRLFVSTTDAAPGSFRFAIANGANTAAAALATDLSLNTPHLVVLRYEVTTATTTLWLDPAAESDASVTAADSATPATMTSFAFRQPASSTAGIGTLLVDDLRIGTAFTDVVGSAPATIVSVAATDASAAEAGLDPGVFTLTRTGDTTAELTVNFQLSGSAQIGTDYEALAGSAVIPAGQDSVTVTVTPKDDSTVEESETVQLTLGPSAQYGIGISTATVAIADDEPVVIKPVVTIVATDAQAAEAGTSTGAFTVSRTGDTGAELVVSFSVSGTAESSRDFGSIGGSVTIPPGAESAQILVAPIDDPDPEPAETVTLTLTSKAGYELGDPKSATVTIADDDTPPPAGVVLSEKFDYPDGPIVGASSSPWVNHSGDTNEANVVGGQLELTQAESEDINAPLSGGPYTAASGAVLYASFKVNFSALPGGAGSYFASFKGAAATALKGRILAATNNAAPGSFRLAVANDASAAVDAVPWPSDLSLGTTYLVVARYEVAAAATTLWLNPAKESDASVTAADSATVVSITSYAFRQPASTSTGIGTLLVDDLIVGLSFADVIGASSGAAAKLGAAEVTAAGEFRFTVTGEAGRTYSIQATADFKTWPEVGTLSLDGTTGQFKEAIPQGAGFRFYRAVLSVP
ncbi:MAG: hypothetical protein HYY24_09685 [Verrucomicrobia bacterium]|nr:hypothetical protein [Verrucomicrobiota bacterium]